MSILFRYLFKSLMIPLIFLLVAFGLLFIVGDLMNNGEDFLNAKTPFVEVLRYYSLRLPSMLVVIIPLCLLLAVLHSLSSLTRHSEIIAMRASGISMFRITQPYFLISILCLLVTAFINEYVGPKFAYRANQFLKAQGKNPNKVYSQLIAYKNPIKNQRWRIQSFNTLSNVMHNVKLTQQREDGSDQIRYTAKEARWTGKHWIFLNGAIQEFDQQGNLKGLAKPFHIREMKRILETPDDFLNEIKDPAYKSSTELWKHIQTHQYLSQKTLAEYEVNFYRRLAMPFICLVIITIGIPVGSHTGRRGAFAGIMLAIGMFVAFYLTQFFMIYLAKQMIIASWLGPWGAIFLFLFIGFIMIYRMR